MNMIPEKERTLRNITRLYVLEEVLWEKRKQLGEKLKKGELTEADRVNLKFIEEIDKVLIDKMREIDNV